MRLKLFKKTRVLILIFFLIISYLAINPQFDTTGVAIKNVKKDSSASFAGIENPKADAAPTSLEIIKSINNVEIKNLKDYSTTLSSIPLNESVQIETNKKTYRLLKTGDIGLTVIEVPTSNIRKGLDLSGGTRVLLKPEIELTEQEREELIQVMEYRINTYGISDVKIRKADDLPTSLGGTGSKFILLEIAGATQQEVRDLIAAQGKFEAKIGNETVFEGGKKDIPFVCRNDGTCSGIIPPCQETSDGWRCKFEFRIDLSENAAQRHAEITKNLDINMSGGGTYLSKPLDLYLDGKLVDSLLIGASLKGQPSTHIAISGPGTGATKKEAAEDALREMKKLQTILITGSLPSKLKIVKLDSISPILGEAFIKNAIIAGLLALLSVILVIYIRYRNIKILIPMAITAASEIIIILGLTTLIKFNLDLAAIAGLIAAVGTGVDDQIVIIDEVTSKKEEYQYKIKQKIKRAFFIILVAYATTVAAMLPLLRAGAGLLTGFAIITIVGVSIGVFITRPAFAAITQALLEED